MAESRPGNETTKSSNSLHSPSSQTPVGFGYSNDGENTVKNPWSSSAVEEMVLMTKRSYEELLPPLHQVAEHRSSKVVIAPIMLGDTGSMAYNANAGVTQDQLHEPQYPGVLPFDAVSCHLLQFEPHVMKLVKNDFAGINPFQDYNEQLTFQVPFTRSDRNSHTIWEHQGVFTWTTLQKKDKWLTALIKYTSEDIAPDSVNGDKLDSIPQPTNPNQNASLHQENPVPGDSAIVNDPEHVSTKFSTGADTLGLVLFDGNIQLDLHLFERLRQMLPNKKVIWTLVKRFFLVLYAFCPALDEGEFRKEMTKIIGLETYEPEPVTLNLTSRMDLIHLASLLVMLRFSFVSLFSNRQSLNESILRSNDPVHQELKYLFTHPIDVNAIEICQSCLNQFLLQKPVTIPLFLLGMLLRAYRYHAPEERDGLDGDFAQRLGSILVNMGYSLGLNRDPENFPNQVDVRTANFIRKAWMFLCITDIFQGYRYGNPTSTNYNFFDTHFPTIDYGMENVFDKDLDRAVVKILNIGDSLVDGAMKEIVDLSLNVRRPAHLSYLTSLLNLLELSSNAAFGSLKDYLRPLEAYNAAYSYGKLMKCAIVLSLQIFFISMMVHIAEYYKAKHNSPLYYYYTKKLLYMVVNEVVPIFPSFTTKLEVLFGDGVCIFVNPVIIDAMYRVNEIFISNILKCNNYLHFKRSSALHESRMANDPNYFAHFNQVCELVVLLQKFCKLCIAVESIMSTRYYFAWRTFKSHQSFVLAMSQPRFYETAQMDPEASPTEGPHNFTSSQLGELIDILKKGLAFVEKQVNENSEELSCEKIWGKPNRVEVPIILMDKKPSHDVRPTFTSSQATNNGHLSGQADSAAMSPQDEPTPLAGDLFPVAAQSSGNPIVDMAPFDLHDVYAFNDYQVDSLWQQMSSQKTKFHDEMDRATWLGF